MPCPCLPAGLPLDWQRCGRRTAVPVRVRERVCDRGRSPARCPGAEFAAAGAARPLRRADQRHAVHRAARREPALVAVPHAPVGGAQAVRAASRAGCCAGRRSTRCRAPPNQLRWDPLPMPDGADGLRRRAGHAWPATAISRMQTGVGDAHLRREPVDDTSASSTTPTARC